MKAGIINKKLNYRETKYICPSCGKVVTIKTELGKPFDSEKFIRGDFCKECKK